jgi:hypothetical protein
MQALVQEVFHRYSANLGSHGLLLGLLLAAWLSILVFWYLRPHRLQQRGLQAVLLVAILALGLVLAWQLRWIGDDAFISFRYARNLLDGHGLVYNPGERVEGYTNFLWTLLIASGMWLGWHPVHVSLLLGLTAFMSTAWLAYSIGRRELSDEKPVHIALLFAPLWIVASYVMASFGTSGLETMFAAACVLASLRFAQGQQWLLAGTLGIAAALAHPDHILFYGALGLALLLRRTAFSSLLRYAAPFFFIALPWFLWRWHYYGDFWPNTFYAKNAGQSHYRQGVTYLLVSLFASGLVACLPLLLVGLWARRRSLLVVFSLIALPIYCSYVAKIGGDFMLGRLLVTPAALLFIVAALGLEHLFRTRRHLLLVVLGTLGMLATVQTPIVQPWEKAWGIADESSFYRLRDWRRPRVDSIYMHEADMLRRQFAGSGLQPRIATDCIGVVGYETGLPLFDLFGLTSRSIAHMPISRRGRPGHEKYGSAGHVIENGADISLIPVYPEPYAGLTRFQLDGFTYHLVRHDADLVNLLRAKKVYGDFQRDAMNLIKGLAEKGPEHAACDAWFLRDYYLKHQADADLAALLADALLRQDPSQAEFIPFLLHGKQPQALAYQAVSHIDFSPPLVGWQFVGNAFAKAPSDRPVADQARILNAQGPLLNSFLPGVGDGAVGTLRSPPFEIRGDMLSFRIGGGRDPQRIVFRLRVDGVVVRQATGCQTEILRDVYWNLRPWKGRTAQLEIEDGSINGWGHILLDEVVEWAAPAGMSK